MNSIRLIKENFVDIPRLRLESEILMNDYAQGGQQLTLTSETGDDDWFGGTGGNPYPESYNVVNKRVQGSYIHELINMFPGYCRWRLLLMEPKTTYSIHYDGRKDARNYRIHIPVTTNFMSLMMFFNHNEIKKNAGKAQFYRMLEGNIYLFYASNIHTALNCSITEKRLHIVGEKNVQRYT